jgi:hypothetical protein
MQGPVLVMIRITLRRYRSGLLASTKPATLYRQILRDEYRQGRAFDFLDEPRQLIRGLEISLFAGRL